MAQLWLWQKRLIALLPLLVSCGSVEALRDRFQGVEPRVVLSSPHQRSNKLVWEANYIVAFRSDLSRNKFFSRDYRSEYREHYLRLEPVQRFTPGVKDFHYITGFNLSNPSFKPKNDWKGPVDSHLMWDGLPDKDELASIVRVEFDDEDAAKRILNQWELEGRIYFAEPNYLSKLNVTARSYADYGKDYKTIVDGGGGLWMSQTKLVDAFSAITEAEGASPPLIAVMDSGVDIEHPSLSEKIFHNQFPNYAGCVDDVNGCNTTSAYKGVLGNGDVFPAFTSGYGQACEINPETFSICAHGTHVAGIVAAEPDLESGYGGMCPNCQIMPIRIVGIPRSEPGDESSIADSSIIAGLTYISRFKFADAGNAIRIVNASFGKFQRSRTVEHLVRLLRENENGIIVIAAAGNEDTDKRQFPAAFNDVIAVTNIESDSQVKAKSSNFGPWTDIAAPGSGPCGNNEGVNSTIPGGESFCMPGTSMAAPVVSGIAGLLLTQEPGLSAGSIRDRLLYTTDVSLYKNAANSGYFVQVIGEPSPVPLLGTGAVNAFNALKNITAGGGRPHRVVDRVSSDCGVIKGHFGNIGLAPLAVYFMIPLFIILGLLPLQKSEKSEKSKSEVL